MKQRVFIEKYDGYVETAITEDGILEHFYRLDEFLITGSIAIGRVEKVITQLGAFVDIGREKNALLKFRDGIKSGDTVIVQVTREEEGDKGCAVTESIVLPGRYVVFNAAGEYRYSRKISDSRKLELSSIRLPEKQAGLVFRTACEFADNAAVAAEAQTLFSKYGQILERAKNNYTVGFIYRESGLETAKRFALEESNITYSFAEIADVIKNIGERKIEIDGVELVFDKTEAMTVIDINSHGFEFRYKDAEEANYRANLAAVKEIARQLRLRNIGGIIMVDLISVKPERQNAVLEQLKAELGKDNVSVKAELIESLSIIALVRKKRYGENR